MQYKQTFYSINNIKRMIGNTFLKYQKKSTFSIPMNATPAAEPITNMDPPVPAQNATNCQNSESWGKEVTSYIPIVAATNGTLSIIADMTPIALAISSLFWT
jgi:hypothetical protein